MSCNDVWLALQRNVSSTLQNWDLRRPYTASLAIRREGFTEEWVGNSDGDHDAEWSKIEKDQVENLCALPHPPCRIRLVQFRPAWMEQLVLRVARISHVVLNYSYATTESTGPLPYLQDLGGKNELPAMVGRKHTKNCTSSNAILDFLRLHHDVDLDRDLNPAQQQQSILFTTLIHETLTPCLSLLRYQDRNAWEQIYRPQCLSACIGGGEGTTSRKWGRPIAACQAWSERVQAISELRRDQRQWSMDQAIQKARQAYETLDRQLEQQTYLLGTEQPAVVDCLLWDHLLQALTDIHLVIVLADFPALLKFTQNIWETYNFAAAVDDNDGNTSTLVWNFEENAANAFNEVPMLPPRKRYGVDDDDTIQSYERAVNLRRELSNQYLHQSLIEAKKTRQATESKRSRNQRPLTTWHRWRMGDSMFPKSTQSADSSAAQQEKQALRDYKRNDEIWMAGVAAITIAVILGVNFADRSRQAAS